MTRSPRRSPRHKASLSPSKSPLSQGVPSPGARSSPRLAARNEAAKSAARQIADSIRERVWAEAKANDGTSYYYSLATAETSWTLPAWAILRAAGRDSICPPRPSVGKPSRTSSFRKSSRASSNRDSRASSNRNSRIDSIGEDESSEVRLSELVAAAEDEVAAEEEDDDGEELDAAEEEAPPANPQLQELLHPMLGWLAETKALYQQTRAEMQRLRVDQMGGMQQVNES